MRGSLLIDFNGFPNQIAADGLPFRFETYVNGVKRDLQYNRITKLYSTYLFVDDECIVTIYKNCALTLDNTVYRVDYTTDEENSDRGIKNTNILTSIATIDDLTYDINFTATTRNDSYDFEYRVSIDVENPCYNIGNGYNSRILDVKYKNCKLYIGGGFTSYNNIGQTGITVTDRNGDLDSNFINLGMRQGAPGQGGGPNVRAIFVDNDDKILVNGNYYGGINVAGLTRLNSDGSIDITFSGFTGDTSISIIQDIEILSDNKILISGELGTINGITRQGIAKLNIDGSLDSSFGSVSGFTNQIGTTVNVFDIEIQNDGKILCVGNFTDYSGISRNNICRLNNDGSLDLTFISPLEYGFNEGRIGLFTNNKILISDRFLYNNIAYVLLKLNSDGTIDDSFNKNLWIYQSSIGEGEDFAITSNNKIIWKRTTATAPPESSECIRLDENGNIDNTFNKILFNTQIIGNPEVITLLEDLDTIYIGGNFTSANSIPYNSFIATDLNGNLQMCPSPPSPSVTPTSTTTPSITPSLTATPSITPTSSLTPTPSETPTSSLTPTPSETPTSSLTPTPSITPSETPTSGYIEPSITPTSSLTPTPSITPSETPTSSLTPTPSETPTSSLTPTPSLTATPSITPSSSPPSQYNISIYVNNQNTVTINGPLKTYYKIDSGSWTLLNDTFNSTVCTNIGTINNIPNNSTLYIGFEDSGNVPVGFDAEIGNSSSCPGISGGGDYCKGTSDWSEVITSSGNRAFTIEASGGEYLAC